MKLKKEGFSVVELLTVLAIIALLVGILVPTMNTVRNVAKEARQRAQFAAIEQALIAFRADYGDFPYSFLDETTPSVGAYCGAQKLCEALLGWDLLGFHPGSAWKADGWDGIGNQVYISSDDFNLEQRVGPYLDVAKANAFMLGQLFSNSAPLADRYVLCDSFGRKDVHITINAGTPNEKTISLKAGRPILYYRANPASKILTGGLPEDLIYNYNDNADLIALPALPGLPVLDEAEFINLITDPQATTAASGRLWPYKADSFILISAGIDGIYGTADDITNFKN